MRHLMKMVWSLAILFPAWAFAQGTPEEVQDKADPEEIRAQHLERAAELELKARAAYKSNDLAVRHGIAWLSRQQCVNCHFHVPKTNAAAIGDGLRLAQPTKSQVRFFDEITPGQAVACSRNAEQKKPVTYLGVTLSAVPLVVRRHVTLPTDMGLLVEVVDADSPAQAAGLAKYDLLYKIDEQLLVNPEQFSVLIRTFKPGTEVLLSAIAQNEPKVLRARLAQREENVGVQGLSLSHLALSNVESFDTTARYSLGDVQQQPSPLAYINQEKGGGLSTGTTAPARKTKAVTHLGVQTSPPAEALARQLKLLSGTGLMITSVKADTPAAQAGLKPFDVLQKLNEQILVNSEQLTTLIRAHRSGDEIRLLLIREGKPQIVSVVLGQHEIEVAADEQSDFPDRLTQASPANAWQRILPQAETARWTSLWARRTAADKTTDVEFARRAYLDIVGAPMKVEELKAFEEDARQDKRQRLVDELLTRPEAISRSSGSTAVKWSDREHTLTLVSREGTRHLLVQDVSGKTIFDGPIDSPEARQSLPKDVAVKLEYSVQLEANRVAPAAPRDLLEKPLPQIEWKELPFREAIEQLRQQSGANLVVNWKVLKQAGVNAQEPISLSLRNVRLATVLTTLLSLVGDDKAQLNYAADGEVIFVTVKKR